MNFSNITRKEIAETIMFSYNYDIIKRLASKNFKKKHPDILDISDRITITFKASKNSENVTISSSEFFLRWIRFDTSLEIANYYRHCFIEAFLKLYLDGVLESQRGINVMYGN